jgi:predicted MFS family arabinose efflux permease
VSGLFALFAYGRGITGSQTTDLLALFGLGGLLLQYAVGWLADHRGVGTAALWCALGTALVCVALALPMGPTLVMLAVFLLGGFITAFLTLALIASTMTKSGSMAGNVSLISMLYTLSAVAGPLLAGAAMKARGTDALMWSTAVAALMLVLALAWLRRAKQSSWA